MVLVDAVLDTDVVDDGYVVKEVGDEVIDDGDKNVLLEERDEDELLVVVVDENVVDEFVGG